MGGNKGTAPGKSAPAAPVFETLPILDDDRREPKTGAAIPSVGDVRQAKKWVDENEL